MLQKIVIRVKHKCQKCQSKSLMIAAMSTGVNSVALQGEKKDEVVIIGEQVDAAGITTLLRKKVGHASLVLVDEIK
ncbi:heavy metal-associated isoprenylated plant protein 47-like [Nicotiana tabacum]|uniref:Heavy metal-associated isoprenylated plant protein 47-like n=1 Tax=Nicotiana tabacum TaxID=4097 RepID=A0AC58TMJ2_TOBAC|nr:heavy metal-associated isoprenylated plant protein 47-like [Nicotiana tomentosiformis]